ncbi:phytase [Actinomadura luteofluorescens]|uniref:phytase n=1 Tax=Actinomadura luteofluorescens TaxID=46163 RepID=UPI00362E21C9
MQLRPTPQGARLAAAATTAALAAAFLSAVPAAADGDELAQVRAALETPANLDDDAGGNANADDPAIWSHPDDRDGDLIVATLKQGGLAVYDAADGRSSGSPPPPRPGPATSPDGSTTST